MKIAKNDLPLILIMLLVLSFAFWCRYLPKEVLEYLRVF